ncbi:winged helix-turn-helix domain-containing protein [Variovorax sp. KK3]|uniref:winged helix-turn-helix domain-containing protein n=1 Tax=Variovorax sp. KK3 TaxID=1855728 RepID=UPI00097BDCF8|nr:winged helix-turn-helix domain-containing protein [Variovorax sp. KK3]
MTTARLNHRLTAVLAADAEGYSRLMAVDERRTLAMLDAAREVFRHETEVNDGRVVDTAGDSVLAVFGTAQGALDAALAIQQQLAAALAGAHDDHRLLFRIGIHLCDLFEKPDGTVYGNGVNVAARLQSLADAGGIALSEAAHGAIGHRVDIHFDDLGLHSGKNLPEPIHAFALRRGHAGMQIAGFHFDNDRGELRDAAQRVVTLSREARAVLTALAGKTGRVVTKEALLAAVWPDGGAADDAAARAVGEVRAALGAAGFEMLKTIPGQGYMLFAGVERGPTGPMAAPVRLPVAPGQVFGRAADLAAIEELLAQHRLVTIIGAGGVGKTMVALATAHARALASRDGVAWVGLAPLDDAALLPSTIATALGLPFGGADPLPGLLSALAPLQCTIVLDNAEHLVDSVARLAVAVLGAAAQVRLLVTSQAPLKVEQERVYRLGGLALPLPGDSAASARQAPAVAMFLDHAKAADERFQLADGDVETAASICARLDAMPLAIRLAASRVRLLGLRGLESRLAQRLAILSGSGRDTPDRQRTLRAALDWSVGLLSAPEARVFRLLGVFVGGFTLDLAQALCDELPGDGVAVLDVVQSLADRSLLNGDSSDPPRWRMPESAREYAIGLLGGDGTRIEAARAHAHALVAAFERAEPMQAEMTDAEWLALWSPELDNLRAALDWAQANDIAFAVRAIAASTALFSMLALSQELRRRARDLDAASAEVDPLVAGRYWFARAHLQMNFGDEVMHSCAARAESYFRGLNEPMWLYQALCLRAMASSDAVDSVDAMVREIDAIEQQDWPARWRLPRFMLGFGVATKRRRHVDALASAERGLQLARSCGAMAWAGHFMNQIAVAQLGLHRYDDALRTCSDGLSEADIQSPGAIVVLSGTMANCLLKLDRLPEARQALARLFKFCRTIEWRSFEFFSHVYYTLAFKERRLRAAALLLGYATAAQNRSWRGFDLAAYRERHCAQLVERLGDEALQTLLAQGAKLAPAEVCVLTLEHELRVPAC